MPLSRNGHIRTAVAADRASEAVLDAVPKQLLIGGRWRGRARAAGPSRSRTRRRGETIAEVADATPDDALAALAAAHDAAGRVGASTRRASAARSCAAPTS